MTLIFSDRHPLAWLHQVPPRVGIDTPADRSYATFGKCNDHHVMARLYGKRVTTLLASRALGERLRQRFDLEHQIDIRVATGVRKTVRFPPQRATPINVKPARFDCLMLLHRDGIHPNNPRAIDRRSGSSERTTYPSSSAN